MLRSSRRIAFLRPLDQLVEGRFAVDVFLVFGEFDCIGMQPLQRLVAGGDADVPAPPLPLRRRDRRGALVAQEGSFW